MKPTLKALAYWGSVLLQVAMLVAIAVPKVTALRTGRTVFLKVVPVDPYSLMSGYYATLSYDASRPMTFYPVPDNRVTTDALRNAYLAEVHYEPTTATMQQVGLSSADLPRHIYNSLLPEPARDARSLARDYLTTEQVSRIRSEAREMSWSSVKAPFTEGDRVFAVMEETTTGQAWRPLRLVSAKPAALASNQVSIRGRYGEWRITYGIEEFYIPESERDQVSNALREQPDNARAEVRVDRSGTAALVALHIGARTWRSR